MAKSTETRQPLMPEDMIESMRDICKNSPYFQKYLDVK